MTWNRSQRWWPADVHVIGKNITRFHCLYWPAMLMSAGLPLPRQVFAHGFMLDKGAKMSKTQGNVLDPDAMVAQMGVDGVRYVVLREVPFDRDADVSLDGFLRRYNADLANDFGNLLNRTLNMTSRYLEGERPEPAAARRVGAWGRLVGGVGRATSQRWTVTCCTRRWPPCGSSWRRPTGSSTGNSRGRWPSRRAPAMPRRPGGSGRHSATCWRRVASLRWRRRRSCPTRRERVHEQLGLAYDYSR